MKQVISTKIFFSPKKAVLLALTVAQFALPAFGAVDTSWVTSDAKVLAQAKAITKTLPRTVTVYHWVDRANIESNGVTFPKSGPVDTTRADIKKLVEENIASRMERFWDTSLAVSGRAADGGAMAPNGFYVATEPVISRRWGGPNPAMYQMDLPAGMRFIDGRSRTPAMGKELIAALASRGCTNPLKGTEFSARSLIKADTKQVACRQALNDIAAAVEAKAVVYVFNKEPVPNCKPWNAAFVMISPDGVAPGSVQPVVLDAPEYNDGLSDIRAAVNGVYKLSGLKPEFKGVGTTEGAELSKYMKANYFGCSDEYKGQE